MGVTCGLSKRWKKSKELRTKWYKFSLQPKKCFDILDIPHKHICYVNNYVSGRTTYSINMPWNIQWMEQEPYKWQKIWHLKVPPSLFHENPPQSFFKKIWTLFSIFFYCFQRKTPDFNNFFQKLFES